MTMLTLSFRMTSLIRIFVILSSVLAQTIEQTIVGPIPIVIQNIGPSYEGVESYYVDPIIDRATASDKLPSDVLDLSYWYITLPSGAVGTPLTIRQPVLKSYQNPLSFYVDPTGLAVVFRAQVGGVTTKNSLYPRSELREMMGSALAKWSMTDGCHVMTYVGAVYKLPAIKSQTVIGQIRIILLITDDTKDDVIEIRVNPTIIEVIHNSIKYGFLDTNYFMGKKYTIRILAEFGVINVYYNDMTTAKVKVPAKATNNYFKVGAYTQSNPTKGDKPGEYSEAWVYALSVQHIYGRTV